MASRIDVRVSVVVRHPIDAVFAHLTDVANLSEFVGFGPIPGIREAKWENEDGIRLGAIRTVVNTDGTQHREEVVGYDPPRRIEDRIFDVTSPLRHLAKDIRDEFVFETVEDGTRIVRTFSVEPKNRLAVPVVSMMAKTALRPALLRHLEALEAAI